MLKSVFLCDRLGNISDVYSQKTYKKICEYTESLGSFSSFDELVSASVSHEIEVIFSSWNMPIASKEIIESDLPKLKAIFYAAGSAKYFAEPYLRRGVRVFTSRESNAIAVADYVTGAILLANKGFYQAANTFRKGLYKYSAAKARSFCYVRTGNYEAKVGLIGFGNIARKVANRLRDYSFEIFAYDPYVSEEEMSAMNVNKASLQDIFTNCDVISNHLPDVSETKNILNYGLFSLSKDGITFINTGRGEQIVDKDLARMLRNNKKSCAVLDVVRHENLIMLNPLYYCKNVFFTPHIAGSQSSERHRLGDEMLEAFLKFENGENSSSEVTIDALRRMA